MSLLRSVSRRDDESRELIVSSARNLISVVAALYLAWHFIATLTWPKIFSPSLWVSTLMMLIIVSVSLGLLERHYLVSLAVWLGGLTATIVQAYLVYSRPEVLILLAFLPLMGVVSLGVSGAFLVELIIIGTMGMLARLSWAPGLPAGYATGVILGSIFTGFFGWGLSSNLISAFDAASYHFSEARRLLEETRQHRAEISRMLKDRNQANYQLERLNQMLSFARRRAEEARSDRDRFVLAVSHELRSPLNFILGFSDLMVNSPETYAPIEEWPMGLYDDVQDVYHSSKHLLSLINDILDMGQIEAQQMGMVREPASLERLVEDVRKMVEPAFVQKGLWLKTECESGLPEVFVDCTRIRQVLLNLVNNSLRFTEQGGVTIGLRREGDALQVRVEDTGSGIAEEDVPKVFDEFRQVGLERWRRREGSGLGLSISRRFVELHKGKMWLESQLGMGTTIYFSIPTLDADSPEDSMGVEYALGNRDAFGSGQPRRLVLVLTDDIEMVRIVQGWLEEYQVVPLDDVSQLRMRVSESLPHAVLVDRALVDERFSLKDLPYDLPVVNLFYPGGRERARVLPYGVSRYLVKPVTRQALLEAVQDLNLRGRRLLVVDDDAAMLRFVAQVFRVEASLSVQDTEKGYELILAQSAEEAIRILREQEVDGLLLDLDLPDRSGWDVLAQVQQGLARSQPGVAIVSALDLPQMLFYYGQSVLELSMKRAMTGQELGAVLKPLLDHVHPNYPGGEALTNLQ
ncbi:MAG: ATP-binding protein [Chloroflexota bacterium]